MAAPALSIVQSLLNAVSQRSGSRRNMYATGGGGARSTYIPQQENDTAAAETPEMSQAYIGQQQAISEATGNEGAAPEAAVRYTAGYTNDPEWRAADREEAAAVRSLSSAGGQGLNWLTGGQHFSSVATGLRAASHRKSERERLWRDEMSLRLASQEQFPNKPTRTDVYDPETGTYSNQFEGSRGTVIKRETPRPQREMVNEHGVTVTATKGPANQGWVTEGARPPSETTVNEWGGEADVEETMPVVRDAKVLAENAKAKAAVAKDEAATAKDRADAKIKDAERGLVGVNVPPGTTRRYASGETYTAPLTPAQKNAGGTVKPMSTKDKFTQARLNALAAVPKPKLSEFDPDAQKKIDAWQDEYDSRFESELESIMAAEATPAQAPAGKPSDGHVTAGQATLPPNAASEVKKLRPGQTIRFNNGQVWKNDGGTPVRVK